MELPDSDLRKRLTEDQVALIMSRCTKQHLKSGEILCRAGEFIDCLYFVVSGGLKLTVTRYDGQTTTGFVNSGETFGQYGFLFHVPSIADAEANSNSELLVLSREEYERLRDDIPDLDLVTTSTLHEKIRALVEGRRLTRFARNVGFIGNSPECENVFAEIGNRLLARGERVAAFVTDTFSVQTNFDLFPLTSSTTSELQSPRRYDRVLYFVDPIDLHKHLNLFVGCDEILYFFDAYSAQSIHGDLDCILDNSEPERIRRICLLRSGECVAPHGLEDPRLKHRDFILPMKDVGERAKFHRQGLDRIHRYLCNVRIGLCLAGGGARGLAHLGVLRALDNAGVSFDHMSGTSAGAMFGLTYAAGIDPDFAIEQYKQALTPERRYSIFRNPDRPFLLMKYRSHSWDRMLRPFFHDWTFERLPIPFSSVSVDLVSGKEDIRDSGDVVESMIESFNLPGISSPILRDGKALVDGGVLNNLPATVLRDHGADYVMGVKVGSDIDETFGKNNPDMLTAEMHSVGLLETLFRVWEVMGSGTSQLQLSAINLLIDPDTSDFSFTDFTKGSKLADIGHAAMEEAMPQLKRELAELLRFNRR